ncbi:ankyrin repeat-containing protein [Anaeramoeba flamelloides]|uniref:Ankyrin repeat-containing protein n=1 Tax=Anaeramoeba flamelloides TaxID=1746091 RepID=A0ABQ8Z744_9EUKA|nr:ankyrin repeat-containing protein [Anaeramoeba flamelloides]
MGNQQPLLRKMCNEDIEKIQKIIHKRRKHLNDPDKTGDTPLHFVIRFGLKIEIAKLLIEKGANVNQLNKISALHLSCKKNENLPLVKYLIENGADVNLKDNEGNTPLHYCGMYTKTTGIMEYLLDNGADPEQENNQGETPIFSASTNSVRADLIKLLIERGVNLNHLTSNGNHLIHYAGKFNLHPEIIQLFLDNKADVNLENKKRTLPLHLACQWGADITNIQKLVENGANKNLPLHMACANKAPYNVIKYLVDKTDDINTVNKYNMTPLLESCSRMGEYKTIKYLLKSGSDIKIRDHSGANALLVYPKIKLTIKLLHLFLKYGCDINDTEDHDFNVLYLACKTNSDIDLIKEIIWLGCNPNILNKSNRTALSTTCHRSFRNKMNPEILKILLSSGADVNIPSYEQNLFYVKESPEDLSIFETYTNFSKEIEKSFQENYITDATLELESEEKIRYHKILFELRLGSEENCEKFLKVLKTKTKEQANLFFKWVYGNVDIWGELKEIIGIFEELNLKKFYYQKAGTYNLLKDFKTLNEDNEKYPKDFEILVENKPIKVHKFVLCARSGLFRNMFSSIEEEILNISDYSQKSFETIQILINYFYSNSIDCSKIEKKKLPNILLELADLFDYYQLEQNSTYLRQLKKLGINVKKVSDLSVDIN